MAKEKKMLSEKEIAKKIKELKIELLKNPTKKGRVKKEIARLLTMRKKSEVAGSGLQVADKDKAKLGGTKA